MLAWYEDNSNGQTHPVGTKAPNGLGLYDMSGTVYEWCRDWYDETFYAKPEARGRNPVCVNSSSGWRVLRGGSWDGFAGYVRCAYRDGVGPGFRSNFYGFRLVCLPQDS